MKEIKVYSTNTCPYCHALIDWLDSIDAKYEVIDASQRTDITAVPVTEIDGQRIVGFDRPSILKALNS